MHLLISVFAVGRRSQQEGPARAAECLHGDAAARAGGPCWPTGAAGTAGLRLISLLPWLAFHRLRSLRGATSLDRSLRQL